MKNNRRISLTALIIMLMLSINNMGYTQPNRQNQPPVDAPTQPGLRFMDRIPDLSSTQRDQITKLHTSLLKSIQPLQNQIGEKEAQLRTLTTADKPDQKAIDKMIDEITVLKGEIQKKRSKFLMEVRSLLTEDQRVVFDQAIGKGNRGPKNSQGRKGNHCRGGKMGACDGNGPRGR